MDSFPKDSGTGCYSMDRRQDRVCFSGNYFFDYPPVDVCEAKVTSLRTVGQLGVVDAQQVQNCCLKIVDVYLALDDSKSQFIGLSECKS